MQEVKRFPCVSWTWLGIFGFVGLIVCGGVVGTGRADDRAAVVKHEVFNGYFVSNKFEPDAAQSFVVLRDQASFDATFGVAFVMRDKSRRLPAGAFDKLLVLGVIKRGMSTWDYQVDEVREVKGGLEVRYSAKAQPQTGATFASPLIVGVPKKDCKSVTFVENKNVAKTIPVTK